MTPGATQQTAPDPGAPDETAQLVSAAAQAMARHPYFAAFPLAELSALIAGGEWMEVPAGTRLLRRGDVGTFALLVFEGTAVVTIDTPYEHVQLAQLEAPAVIGEIAAFTGVARTAHVDALTPIRAVRLSAEALEAAGLVHPDLLSAVMRQFGRRFETFNQVFGFYANALNALERREFDLALLDDLRNPLPEMVDFSHSFRRLAEAIMSRAAERREMANAAAIQRAMLPPPLPPDVLGGKADIFAAMRPAKDVGGDFYDYFLIDGRRLVVTLGDVAGKGTPAALFMSATQTALRMVLRSEPNLAVAVARVNDLLCATNGEDMFVTLFCGVIDLDTGVLTYCNCGHTDCMILRANGAVERPVATGPALAMMEGARTRAETVALAPGDRLFLFSDGLTDAFDPAEEAFGEARLEAAAQAALAAAPDLAAEAFLSGIFDTVIRWADTAPQFDDMTALAVTLGPR